MDRHQLGQRLRGLRAASGRTVAAVAADAGLSVPYVANLENGRGNPTMEALNRIGQALGTRVTIGFVAQDTADPDTAPVTLPPTLVRLGRGTRFRRDIRVMSETLGEDPTALAARVLDALARLAATTARDLSEPDWHRLLDALLLITMHPQR